MSNAVSAEKTSHVEPQNSWGRLPRGRTLVGSGVAYAVLFVALFMIGGESTGVTASGAKIIADYDQSSTTTQIAAYTMVIAAAALIFFGGALRSALQRDRSDWLADVGFAGTIVMGVTLVGFAVTLVAMRDAVDTGNPAVAQAINILDHTNFVPAMLGLCCTLIAVGACGLRSGALPKWLSVASVVLGVLSPLGPAAFAPFALFPVWVVVVGAVTARRMSSERSAA
jgi:hypothetical protein